MNVSHFPLRHAEEIKRFCRRHSSRSWAVAVAAAIVSALVGWKLYGIIGGWIAPLCVLTFIVPTIGYQIATDKAQKLNDKLIGDDLAVIKQTKGSGWIELIAQEYGNDKIFLSGIVKKKARPASLRLIAVCGKDHRVRT